MLLLVGGDSLTPEPEEQRGSYFLFSFNGSNFVLGGNVIKGNPTVRKLAKLSSCFTHPVQE